MRRKVEKSKAGLHGECVCVGDLAIVTSLLDGGSSAEIVRTKSRREVRMKSVFGLTTLNLVGTFSR